MSIILNVNELGYKPFLQTETDAFVIGLKNFCVNQKYVLSLKKLPSAVREIKSINKKIYLSVNLFAKEKDIKRFECIIDKLLRLNIDAFVVSDFGIFNLFIKKNLANKVILDLQTYVTNKYSALSILNLGAEAVSISKEITLEDITEISTYTNGKVEILCHGYVPITHSKRNILSAYYKQHKISKTDTLHYIREENRDNYYLLNEEKDNLTVYNDLPYSLFEYLPNLIESGITLFKIDSNYLNYTEIKDLIATYAKAIKLLEDNKLDDFNKLKEQFSKTYSYSTPFIVNESFLLKEGK